MRAFLRGVPKYDCHEERCRDIAPKNHHQLTLGGGGEIVSRTNKTHMLYLLDQEKTLGSLSLFAGFPLPQEKSLPKAEPDYFRPYLSFSLNFALFSGFSKPDSTSFIIPIMPGK